MTEHISLSRILVVKLADIGDVLTSTPALRALRETYPHARIDILLSPHTAPVLEATGLVDGIIPFDKFQFDRPRDALRPASIGQALSLTRHLRRGRYDAVLILHHLTLRFGRLKYALLAYATGAPLRAGLDNGHGWFLNRRIPDAGFGAFHEVEYWLHVARALGADTQDLHLAAPISAQAERWAEEILPRRPFAVVHPGSGGYSLARRWPVERFAELARHLHEEEGLALVFVGTAGDNVEELARLYDGEALNLAGNTDLVQLAAVLRRAALFVGSDSGVMHLAVAAGAPVLAIFGPTNAEAWGPWTAGRSPAVVVSAGLPCQPCAYVGHAVGGREGCESMDCMRAVRVGDVLTAARTLLHQGRGGA